MNRHFQFVTIKLNNFFIEIRLELVVSELTVLISVKGEREPRLRLRGRFELSPWFDPNYGKVYLIRGSNKCVK